MSVLMSYIWYFIEVLPFIYVNDVGTDGLDGLDGVKGMKGNYGDEGVRGGIYL